MISLINHIAKEVDQSQAMKKSYELLKGRVSYASVFVCGYLLICEVMGRMFSVVVVHDVFSRIVIGGFLVGVLIIVNLVVMLVSSEFYYVCKSYHHHHHHQQGIDKCIAEELGCEPTLDELFVKTHTKRKNPRYYFNNRNFLD
ncbi:transmembrane protein, putative [Medicago truncatula]|uniref:Transmembrane protein, putative n=1 Tax=Medicago truncatula TaxID=3880 RepID=G7J0I8_MEDTR|nr:transmembrane protein, putative [Medicago truncatula]